MPSEQSLAKAREWYRHQDDFYWESGEESAWASLAALLDSVAGEAQLRWAPHVRADTLDEVRRIVGEQRDHALDNSRRLARYDGEADEARCRALAAQHCDEILKRLEGLK